jgi:hypothetical protein
LLTLMLQMQAKAIAACEAVQQTLAPVLPSMGY